MWKLDLLLLCRICEEYGRGKSNFQFFMRCLEYLLMTSYGKAQEAYDMPIKTCYRYSIETTVADYQLKTFMHFYYVDS